MRSHSLKSIVTEIGADSAAIMVPNVAEKFLFCFDSFNMPQVWIDIRNSFDKKTHGGNVWVYETGKAATTNHLQKTLEGHYIESVMILPIIRGKEIVATLELIHDRDNKIFSKGDLKKAEAFVRKINVKFTP